MAKSLMESMIERSVGPGWAASDDDPAKRWWSHLGIDGELNRQSRALGLEPVPNRAGDPVVSSLRPTSRSDARKASLSAQVGLEQQPLHTDGAHLLRVPEFVVLWATDTSPTPTRVWRAGHAARKLDSRGMFVVEPGGEPFLAQAITGVALRYDPGCMTPADAFARDIARVLQNPPEDEVVDIHWDTPGKIVLLRNRVVLHGRATVIEGDSERKLCRIAYMKSAS